MVAEELVVAVVEAGRVPVVVIAEVMDRAVGLEIKEQADNRESQSNSY